MKSIGALKLKRRIRARRSVEGEPSKKRLLAWMTWPWWHRWSPLMLGLNAIAGTVLTGFAIWGFVHTVLPLYQKAVLEEALAQRQIELTSVNRELATAKTAFTAMDLQVRRQSMRRIYELAAPCAGVGLKPERLLLPGLPAEEQFGPRSAFDIPAEKCIRDYIFQALGRTTDDDDAVIEKYLDPAISAIAEKQRELEVTYRSAIAARERFKEKHLSDAAREAKANPERRHLIYQTHIEAIQKFADEQNPSPASVAWAYTRYFGTTIGPAIDAAVDALLPHPPSEGEPTSSAK